VVFFFDVYRVISIKVIFIPFKQQISPTTTQDNFDESLLLYWYVDHDDINPLTGGPTTIESKYQNEGRVPRSFANGKSIAQSWKNPFQNHWFNCAGIGLLPTQVNTPLADSTPPNPFKNLRIGIAQPTAALSISFQGRIYVKYDMVFRGINIAQ